MADYRVRPATRDDAHSLGELGALMVHTHHQLDPRRFMAPGRHIEEGYARFLTSQLGRDDSVVFVAQREDDIIGYVYATLEERSWRDLREACGYIDDILVRDTARQSGVAGALMAAATEWLRAHGAPRVVLMTATANEAAQRLFTRLGFRPTMLEMTLELERVG
jgi:ribosomal protein S18 acetylase RimI-like enzyme